MRGDAAGTKIPLAARAFRQSRLRRRIASGGSVANPLVVERSETPKPAGAAVVKVTAPAGRHDALRRPQRARSAT